MPERSLKDCEAGSLGGKVTCQSVNFGVKRNFQTMDGVIDLQLTQALVDEDFRTYGWVIFKDGNAVERVVSSELDIKEMQLVSQAAIDAHNAGRDSGSGDGDGSGGDGDGTGDGTGDDQSPEGSGDGGDGGDGDDGDGHAASLLAGATTIATFTAMLAF